MPPKSARRRACGNVDNANALPKVPQENKRRRSGHVICYQNRTSSFAIDRTWIRIFWKFLCRRPSQSQLPGLYGPPNSFDPPLLIQGLGRLVAALPRH
jgi:hypothetical protein